MSTRVLPGFTFFIPTTLAEALELVDEYRGKARIIAGGTDVVVAMKCGLVDPGTIISVDKIEELDFIKFSDGDGLELGPLATIHDIETFDKIKNRYPLLIDAAAQFASVQIVNMATIGGNICNASPAGDMLPPLLSMNAELDLVSANGNRTVKLTDFYTGPGKSVMKPGEMVVRLKAPALSKKYGSCFIKICRTAEDLAKVSVAVVLTENGGKFQDVRLSLGAVAPVPLRAFEAEEFLEGREINDSSIEQAVQISLKAISPISDLRSTATYRRDVTGVAIKRAITKALERGKVQCVPVSKV